MVNFPEKFEVTQKIFESRLIPGCNRNFLLGRDRFLKFLFAVGFGRDLWVDDLQHPLKRLQ